MPRKPRLDLVGVAQHVVQRGHNREVCFARDEDFAAYAHWLKEASVRANVSIHAWVFMTNHVHLLVTPHKNFAVSKMMQYLGGRYVPYFNYTYQRSGTLWEGRFKSSLIDNYDYLLKCYRYIELNPVRAYMVDHPDEYRWSSYSINALGSESELCTPHEVYLHLVKNKEERCRYYRELFRSELDIKVINQFRYATKKGLLVGRDDFKNQIEHHLQRKIGDGMQGRPKKNKNVL